MINIDYYMSKILTVSGSCWGFDNDPYPWVFFMVLILDGNSEIGAHIRRNICYLICLMHLIRSKAVTNQFFPPKRFFSLFRAQHVMSYHLIMIPWNFDKDLDSTMLMIKQKNGFKTKVKK